MTQPGRVGVVPRPITATSLDGPAACREAGQLVWTRRRPGMTSGLYDDRAACPQIYRSRRPGAPA
ncbi:MAG: hypothetical protein M3Q48_14160, partial [Actinomycetota bacterium]|nr:hypothetical protein [Actinomycetota bacterium]